MPQLRRPRSHCGGHHPAYAAPRWSSETVQVVADAVDFLGAPSKPKPAVYEADMPADKPAVGAYRRNAS